MGTPKRGEKLYDCDWGTDEIVTYVFIEESIAEGATNPTWVLHELGNPQRIRTSKGDYYWSALAARKARLKQLRDEVKAQRKYIVRMKQQLALIQQRMQEMKQKITKSQAD